MKKFLFNLILIAFFGGAFPVEAADYIDVNFGPGFPINETNLAPGDIIERDITVTNLTSSDIDVKMRLDLEKNLYSWTGTIDLENLITLEIKKPDGTYSSYYAGQTKNYIRDLDGEILEVDGLDDYDSKTYQLIFTFSVEAGNEYQGKKTVFNATVGIEGEPSDDEEDDDGDGNDGGDGDNGFLPTSLTGGIFNPAGGSSGEETPEENNPQGEIVNGTEDIPQDVAGQEDICISWPKWVWILALILFSLILFWQLGKDYKEEKLKWKFAFVWTFVGIFFWYFFDKCREYRWFLYLVIIISLVFYFLYLAVLKRKTRKGLESLQD